MRYQIGKCTLIEGLLIRRRRVSALPTIAQNENAILVRWDMVLFNTVLYLVAFDTETLLFGYCKTDIDSHYAILIFYAKTCVDGA